MYPQQLYSTIPPPTCVYRSSPSRAMYRGRPKHQDLPSSNPTMTTQFLNLAITCGLVLFRLPTTIGKPAPKRVMLPRLATFSNKKNKPTFSSNHPAVRRLNIGTSSVALTATLGSRPSPTIYDASPKSSSSACPQAPTLPSLLQNTPFHMTSKSHTPKWSPLFYPPRPK